MKKTGKILALALALMMIFAGSAMADTIKIAVIGPFTGPAANYGLACRYGAQVARDEINALGGLQIELLFEDDEHDTEKAINAYNAVMEAGAQMIDGTTTTAPCLTVSAVAYEERVFMLTPSASNDGVVADKDNMYQVCFQDPVMGVFSADMIVENNMGTKVAIIYNNADDYSTTIYQSFKAEAEKIGLEVVSVTTFAADDNTDFTVQVADARTTAPIWCSCPSTTPPPPTSCAPQRAWTTRPCTSAWTAWTASWPWITSTPPWPRALSC